MTTEQEKMWDVLVTLTGEQVASLLTQWHGMQLLDNGFLSHLIDEGYLEEEEDDEEEDDEDYYDE